VLLRFLLVVVVAMLAVLRALDRLPAASFTTYLTIGVTLALDAAAALTLGLLTWAAVGNPSQAMLALPMLCWETRPFPGTARDWPRPNRRRRACGRSTADTTRRHPS